MKWIAYLLCLVILTLWALAISVPPDSDAVKQAHRLPRVARLQLASELGKGGASATSRVASIPVHPVSSPLPTSAVPALSSSTSLSAAEPTSVVLPGSGGTGPSSGPKTPAMPGSASSMPDPQITTSAPAQPAGASPSVCLLVVNIDSAAKAKALVTDMAGKGVKGEVRAREEPLPSLHWVLTPKYPDRAAALKALKRFQRQGVDSFLVTRGDMANAISLGIFQSETAAHHLMRKLKSRGIKARMAPYERTRTVYWARFPGLTRDQSAALRKWVAVPEKPPGDEQIIDCQGVASTGKSP